MARGKSKQDYATPPEFMLAVTSRFGPISFDLAASAHNTKHPKFYSEADDSLKQEWGKDGLLWLNPPFDNITPWARKCAMTQRTKILFLVPASVGSNWFRDYVYRRALVLFLNGRIAFDPLHPTWGYPKDCMLACYGLGDPGFDVWTWPEESGI